MADDVKRAQLILRSLAGYAGGIDGIAGAGSVAAARRALSAAGVVAPDAWPARRVVFAGAQAALAGAGADPGPIDGLYGPATDAAYMMWAGVKLPSRPSSPVSEAAIRRRFGAPGSAACTGGRVVVPWPMVLAWDTSTPVRSFACHEDVQADMARAFGRVADVYTDAEIIDLGLHLFGGCYNYRPMRGGSRLSLHSWGIALDSDPMRNRLKWGADRARLGRPDARLWFDAWASVGWYSLGREKNYDWMHVQAVAP